MSPLKPASGAQGHRSPPRGETAAYGRPRAVRWAFLAVMLVLAHPAWAADIHFSPEERLDQIDAELIATARTSIDLASYALTDRLVIEALDAAQRRGVAVRIVLDPREPHDFVGLGDLADTVRVKRGGALMHLKAYEVDGAILRTGSANFSRSGENAQDNDLVILRDATAAARFEAHFERMWSVAGAMIEFEPAVRAMEPK